MIKVLVTQPVILLHVLDIKLPVSADSHIAITLQYHNILSTNRPVPHVFLTPLPSPWHRNILTFLQNG
jgi:hypothetical protein